MANLRALRLYRDLLRTARKMPTRNQVSFVSQRGRDDFRSHTQLFSAEADFEMTLGETHLETLRLQTDHLTEVLSTPGYDTFHREFDLPKTIAHETKFSLPSIFKSKSVSGGSVDATALKLKAMREKIRSKKAIKAAEKKKTQLS